MPYVTFIIMVIDCIDYPHDGRAIKDSYPHDSLADKNPYPQDRHSQCLMLRL